MMFLLSGFVMYTTGQSSSVSSARFNKMLKNYYEAYIQLDPSTASQYGDYRYNDQLENEISQSYRDQSKALFTRFQDSLRSFSSENLSARDQLSYQIFQYSLKNKLEELKLTSYLTPISQMRDYRLSFSQIGFHLARS